MNGDLAAAAKEYLRRQLHGALGVGKSDSAGRWWPHDSERRECCNRIRQPSRGYTGSLYYHCSTIVHVANLYSVDPKLLRRLLHDKVALALFNIRG